MKVKTVLVSTLVLFAFAGCSYWGSNKRCCGTCPAGKTKAEAAKPATTVKETMVQKVKEKAAEILISLKGATFQNASAQLTPQGKKELDVAVDAMNKNPKLEVEIAGHTSASGSAEANQRLSQKRAESVKAYMVSKGIEAKRLTTAGYGESRPAVNEPNPNLSNTPEAAMNRRVELEVTKK